MILDYLPFLLLFLTTLTYFLLTVGRLCCAQALSRWGGRGLLSTAACGLLIAVASLVVEHRLQGRRLQ